MPKKRKKSSKRESRRNLVIVIILAVIIAVIIFIFLIYKGNEKEVQKQEKQENNILISQDSFAFIAAFYLNEGYDRASCNKELKCQNINGLQLQCPKVDQLNMQFRVFNFDNLAFISCTVTNGRNQYTQQHFAFYPQGRTAELSLQNIAYDKEHDFVICCQYDDGEIKSNEFCLPAVKVKSLCS